MRTRFQLKRMIEGLDSAELLIIQELCEEQLRQSRRTMSPELLGAFFNTFPRFRVDMLRELEEAGHLTFGVRAVKMVYDREEVKYSFPDIHLAGASAIAKELLG